MKVIKKTICFEEGGFYTYFHSKTHLKTFKKILMKTSHLIDCIYWKNLFIINYVRKTSRKDCFNPLSNAPKGYHLNFDFIVFIYQNKIFFRYTFIYL